MSEPRFTHDCTHDGRRFLGYSGRFDLWSCPSSIIGPTLILRYGNDGPQYASFPLRVVKRLPPPEGDETLEALREAVYLYEQAEARCSSG